MARVYITNTSGFTIFYAVDQAVGTGCPNRRDDVLLVQFFLKVCAEGPQSAQYTPPNRGQLKCDGMWGPISQAYLDRYISANSASNPTSPLTKDGRVDPVVNGQFMGARSGNLYTILALNNSFKVVRGIAAVADITTDSVFPADLKPFIKVG